MNSFLMCSNTSCTFGMSESLREMTNCNICFNSLYCSDKCCFSHAEKHKPFCVKKKLVYTYRYVILHCSNIHCLKFVEMGSKTPKMKICGKCLDSRYCSTECQKTHWKYSHKKQCTRPEDTKELRSEKLICMAQHKILKYVTDKLSKTKDEKRNETILLYDQLFKKFSINTTKDEFYRKLVEGFPTMFDCYMLPCMRNVAVNIVLKNKARKWIIFKYCIRGCEGNHVTN
jgi:hypothetical protein